MDQHIRKRRDFIQNISIALLSVSAVLLFTQTQMYNLGAGDGFLRLLSAAEGQASIATPSQSAVPAVPVRVAVSGLYGRYGNITLTTADKAYAPLQDLLEQALGSAQTYTASSDSAFLKALEGTCVYYDFLSSLPLSVLTEAEQAGGTLSARQLLVSGHGERVVLYLWDGANQYLCCDTALSPETLEAAVGQYELGNAFFAFESAESHAQEAAPRSLFLEEMPVLPVLSSTVPLSDTDQLLSNLGFNPNTQNRYREAGGAEVITEDERTLRIYTDGTVIYTSGGDSTLSVKAAGELPALLEAVTEVGTLLSGLLSPTTGEADIYLESIRQSGSLTTLRFGYQAGGVPIRFSDGQYAAQVTLSGTTVSALTLRVRQYSAAGTNSLLLPLRQALAIAAGQAGAELSIGYVDDGAGIVNAGWLAD